MRRFVSDAALRSKPRAAEAVSKQPEEKPQRAEEGAEGAEVRIFGFPPSSAPSSVLCALCVLWGQF
jgi:hypothetical protein